MSLIPATPDLAMGFIFGSARYLSFQCSGYFVAYVAAQNRVCGCGMPSYLACFSSLALYLSFVGCLPFMMHVLFLSLLMELSTVLREKEKKKKKA